MNIFSKNKIAAFWKWFDKNSEDLFNSEAKDADLLGVLENKLKTVSPHACYQFGTIQKGRREFVISADGIIEGAQAVIDLVSAAPKYKQWEVVAFRPRVDVGRIDMGGRILKVDDIKYSYTFSENNRVSLELFVKGYDDNYKNEYMGATFVLIDAIVGEFDAMTKLGTINISGQNTNSEEGLYPLKKLADLLDSRRRNSLPTLT